MSIAMISGLIILVLLVIMLVAGVPIAIALGISSVCAILPVMDLNVAVLTGAQRIFSGISVFSLLAIPFYILAGNIMNKGGIAVRLINLAKLITGRTPGALAHTNVIANMLFGSIVQEQPQHQQWVLSSDQSKKMKDMIQVFPQQLT